MGKHAAFGMIKTVKQLSIILSLTPGKRNLLNLVILSSALSFLLLFSTYPALSDEEKTLCDNPQNPSGNPDDFSDGTGTKPAKYSVEMTLMHIGEINLKSGEYPMDFWIDIRPVSKEQNFTRYSPPQLEFTNAKSISISHKSCASDLYEYKVQGIFYNPMSLKEYPFQVLNLPISIEASQGNLTAVQLLPWNGSGIDSAVDVPGYRIDELKSVLKVHNYTDNDTFSRLDVVTKLETYAFQSILKTLFPIILLPTLAAFSFFIEPHVRNDRLVLILSTLLSSIVFYVIDTSELPSLSYITIFDKAAITGYAVFIYTILSTLYLGRTKKVDNSGSRQVSHNSILGIGTIPLVAACVAFLYFI